MLSILTQPASDRQEILHVLDTIARDGARQMLVHALNAEVNDYLQSARDQRDSQGQALVVKNGKARLRKITLGAGTVEIQAPRVNDRREGHKFVSTILPPYMRKSPKVENLLPLLYLKGLSTNDFKSALSEFLGVGTAGLSASSITSLKKNWDREFEAWNARPITDEYAYVWADGVHMSVRLGEDKRVCLLVVVGVSSSGEKHLLGVSSGYRESKDSWKSLLGSLVKRGLKAPCLAIGDGALGFWGAIRECAGFERTKEQRCWVHKIANVLDKLPKRLQGRAKELLHEAMRADSAKDAEMARDVFVSEFHEKHPKACVNLTKDWKELTAYMSFPALHWQHLRTTNPIESTFATVRLRTRVTKGAGSVKAAEVMTFKLLEDAQKTWKKIRGYKEVANVLKGVEYVNGIMVAKACDQAVNAA